MEKMKSANGKVQSVDTVIIGGGLAGVSTLYALASRGVETLLLEAREGVGLETSYANGAMLTASMPDPWNSPGVGRHILSSLFDSEAAMKLHPKAIPMLAIWGAEFLVNSTARRHHASTLANYTLARYSVEQTAEWRGALHLEFDWSDRGCMKLFQSRCAMEGPLKMARALQPLGLKFEILTSEAAVEAEPQLASIQDKIYGALFFPKDRSGDAHLFTRELAKAAEGLGAHIRFGATCTSVKKENGAVAGILVGEELIRCKQVILACGTAAPKLAGQLGVRLPVKPVKGYSLTYPPCEGAPLPNIPVIDDANHVAIVPVGDRLRAVGSAEFSGFDSSIDEKRIRKLKNLLCEIYPELAKKVNEDRAEAWAGLRPMSADGRPFIGETHLKGLWVNTGHGHLGWTMAVGSALILADMMTGVAPAIDAAPFRINRSSL